MAGYTDIYWWSRDGVRLHARDYSGDTTRPVVLCLPGLTRNARDYDALARRLSPGWRVIAVDLRGRGESGYARDAMTYVPLTYVQDIEGLLAEQGIDRFVAIGTSLGGIVTMLMAAAGRRPVAAVLNDVGPEIEPTGLHRIRAYVGRSSVWPTWMHAARCVQEAHGAAYPGWDVSQWLAMAKRLYRLNSSGRIVLDYDLKIAEPFRVPGNEAGPDMWRALDALAGVPVLVVRGGRSDILSAATAARMAERVAGDVVTLPEVGHAPTLVEADAVAAVDGLLARVAK